MATLRGIGIIQVPRISNEERSGYRCGIFEDEDEVIGNPSWYNANGLLLMDERLNFGGEAPGIVIA